MVTGEFDDFLLVRTRDSDSFNRLHAEQLLYLPGVRQIRSFMVLKQVLSTTRFPVRGWLRKNFRALVEIDAHRVSFP